MKFLPVVCVCAAALTAVAAEMIPGGMQLSPRDLVGGNPPRLYSYMCPERLTLPVPRPGAGKSEVTASFRLERAMPGPVLMNIIGLDDDKPGVSTFSLDVNGKRLFSGANTFSDNYWRAMAFMLPQGLPAGENTIKLINTSPAREGFPDYDASWGWVCFSETTFFDFTGDFRRFAAGEAGGAWQPIAPGAATAAKGVVVLRSKGEGACGIVFDPGAGKMRPGVVPGMKLRVAVKMTGSGELALGMRCFSSRGKPLAENPEPAVFLPVADAAVPETFCAEMPMPSRGRFFAPVLTAAGECDLALRDVAVEVLLPADGGSAVAGVR